MTEPLKPIEFVVDNLISQGLFIPAGAGSDSKNTPSDFTDLPSPKIEKSFCNTLAAGDGIFFRVAGN